MGGIKNISQEVASQQAASLAGESLLARTDSFSANQITAYVEFNCRQAVIPCKYQIVDSEMTSGNTTLRRLVDSPKELRTANCEVMNETVANSLLMAERAFVTDRSVKGSIIPSPDTGSGRHYVYVWIRDSKDPTLIHALAIEFVGSLEELQKFVSLLSGSKGKGDGMKEPVLFNGTQLLSAAEILAAARASSKDGEYLNRLTEFLRDPAGYAERQQKMIDCLTKFITDYIFSQPNPEKAFMDVVMRGEQLLDAIKQQKESEFFSSLRDGQAERAARDLNDVLRLFGAANGTTFPLQSLPTSSWLPQLSLSSNGTSIPSLWGTSSVDGFVNSSKPPDDKGSFHGAPGSSPGGSDDFLKSSAQRSSFRGDRATRRDPSDDTVSGKRGSDGPSRTFGSSEASFMQLLNRTPPSGSEHRATAQGNSTQKHLSEPPINDFMESLLATITRSAAKGAALRQVLEDSDKEDAALNATRSEKLSSLALISDMQARKIYFKEGVIEAKKSYASEIKTSVEAEYFRVRQAAPIQEGDQVLLGANERREASLSLKNEVKQSEAARISTNRALVSEDKAQVSQINVPWKAFESATVTEPVLQEAAPFGQNIRSDSVGPSSIFSLEEQERAEFNFRIEAQETDQRTSAENSVPSFESAQRVAGSRSIITRPRRLKKNRHLIAKRRLKIKILNALRREALARGIDVDALVLVRAKSKYSKGYIEELIISLFEVLRTPEQVRLELFRLIDVDELILADFTTITNRRREVLDAV